MSRQGPPTPEEYAAWLFFGSIVVVFVILWMHTFLHATPRELSRP